MSEFEVNYKNQDSPNKLTCNVKPKKKKKRKRKTSLIVVMDCPTKIWTYHNCSQLLKVNVIKLKTS